MILISLFASCQRNSNYIIEEGIVWNTTYRIVYESDKSKIDSIISVYKTIDNSISAFNDSSTVSRINRNEILTTDFHFCNIFNLSKKIHFQSNGYFDPTVSPIVNAWGFGYEPGQPFAGINTDSLLQFVGINKAEISEGKLIKEVPQLTFNFSAIAKGYGCDEIAKTLSNNNITNYLIEIGGEIVVSGVNPKGDKWRIAIDRPIIDNKNIIHETQTIIELSDGALATSGNYRNYKEFNGTRIGHTINPRTGKPIQTEIVSATIIAQSCAEADAFATACMASDLNNAKMIIENNNLSALLILDNGSVWQSENFNSLIAK